MDYNTRSSLQTLLLLILIVLVGIGVWGLAKPEREAQEKLTLLRQKGETTATLKLTLDIDLEGERVHVREQTLKWDHNEITAMKEEEMRARKQIEEEQKQYRKELSDRLGREPNDADMLADILRRFKNK